MPRRRSRLPDEFIGLSRSERREAWRGWIPEKLGEPYSMLTLTYAQGEVGSAKAYSDWRRLVQSLNIAEVGKRYVRTVGHSYFGYVLFAEQQARGTLHFHALVGGWINYGKVHQLWTFRNGYAWAKRVNNLEGAVEYVTKYVLKVGEPVDWWFPEKEWIHRSEGERLDAQFVN